MLVENLKEKNEIRYFLIIFSVLFLYIRILRTKLDPSQKKTDSGNQLVDHGRPWSKKWSIFEVPVKQLINRENYTSFEPPGNSEKDESYFDDS